MNREQLMAVIKMYEEKLKEFMTDKDYMEFCAKVAKTVFLAEIMSFPDGEFKDFVLDNFDLITKTEGEDDK